MMNLKDTIEAIQNATIKMEDIPAAKSMLENEIDGCAVIVQDHETDFHIRVEYQNKMRAYKKLLNRI